MSERKEITSTLTRTTKNVAPWRWAINITLANYTSCRAHRDPFGLYKRPLVCGWDPLLCNEEHQEGFHKDGWINTMHNKTYQGGVLLPHRLVLLPHQKGRKGKGGY